MSKKNKQKVKERVAKLIVIKTVEDLLNMWEVNAPDMPFEDFCALTARTYMMEVEENGKRK